MPQHRKSPSIDDWSLGELYTHRHQAKLKAEQSRRFRRRLGNIAAFAAFMTCVFVFVDAYIGSL